MVLEERPRFWLTLRALLSHILLNVLYLFLNTIRSSEKNEYIKEYIKKPKFYEVNGSIKVGILKAHLDGSVPLCVIWQTWKWVRDSETAKYTTIDSVTTKNRCAFAGHMFKSRLNLKYKCSMITGSFLFVVESHKNIKVKIWRWEKMCMLRCQIWFTQMVKWYMDFKKCMQYPESYTRQQIRSQ